MSTTLFKSSGWPKDNINLDNGIRRARKFLLLARNYEIDLDHWQELISISKLRNFIVHEGTRITGSYIKPDEKLPISFKLDDGLDIYFSLKPDLYQHLQKHGIFTQSGMFFEISPTFDYCSYLVEFSKKLFYKLCNDLFPNQHASR